MTDFWSEIRRAVRGLSRQPRASLVAVGTLALGIGACTAIFSVVYGVLLRPLPYPHAQRLVQVWQVNDEGRTIRLSDPNFQDLAERNLSLAGLAQYSPGPVVVSVGSEPVRVLATSASRSLFDILATAPIRGRLFVEEELRVGGSRACLVSYGFWQRHLGARTDLSDARLSMLDHTYSVVGVMPPAFDFPPGVEIWVPRELNGAQESRTSHNWRALGMLAEGVSLERARADLSAVARRLRQEHGEDTWMVDAALVPLLEEMVGDVRPALLVLLGAVGMLLLVACANVVNLLLARAASRQKELALCVALGASRWQQTRPFLVESALLSLAGGALGVGMAVFGVDALLAVEPGKLPRVDSIGVSVPMLLFALGVSLLASMVLGLIAAMRTTDAGLELALRQSQRSETGAASSARVRATLVASQVAITLVLLIGAGLLGRSLWRLLALDPGFRSNGALVMELQHTYPESQEAKGRLGNAQRQLLERLRAQPGVSSVGAVDRLPMATGSRNGMYLIMSPGEQISSYEDFARVRQDDSRTGMAEYRAATPDYFQTMEIPLVRGRLFDARDARDAAHVALVSESLAKQRWPGEEPIGKLIQFGNMDGDLRLLRIIGIVGDVRHLGLDRPPLPTLYTNAHQRPPANFTVVFRVNGDPLSVTAAARDVARAMFPGVPPRFQTLSDVVSGSISTRRFNLLLLTAFAAAALGLALMGIYGVVSYAVAQRTRELGIRMALGASRWDVLRLIVGQGLRPILIGVVVGLGVALVMSRLMTSLLYGVAATDPATFLALAVPLAMVALVACYLPARRATAIDPMRSIRYE